MVRFARSLTGFLALLSPFAAAQGDQLWLKRFNDPADKDDRGYSVVADAQGNFYVAGSVSTGATGLDAIILKYSPTGTLLWSRKYNGPENSHDEAADIALGPKGDVYVAGYSIGEGGDYDYITLKFDKAGTRKWLRRYDGPANSTDFAAAIVVDAFDNVTVTGSSVNDPVWENDWTTLSYFSDGRPRWTAFYQGWAGALDRPTSMTTDKYGNVLVAGLSVGDRSIPSGFDFGVVKYSSTGHTVWNQYTTGPFDLVNYLANPAVATDRQQNVIVAGSAAYAAGNADFVIRKSDEFANPIWTRTLDAGGNEYVQGVAVDGNDNVFVTGISDGAGNEDDFFTAKYNALGKRLWTKRFNGSGNKDDYVFSIRTDGPGNAIVTGTTINAASHTEYTTIKYGPDGTVKWNRRILDGFGKAIAIDGSNNVCVTGGGYRSATGYDILTVKYSP